MKCSIPGCVNKAKYSCKCTSPTSFICTYHLPSHLKIKSSNEHKIGNLDFELSPKSNQELREAIKAKTQELENTKSQLIKEAYTKTSEIYKILDESLKPIYASLHTLNDSFKELILSSKISKLKYKNLKTLLNLPSNERIGDLNAQELQENYEFSISNHIFYIQDDERMLNKINFENNEIDQYELAVYEPINDEIFMCPLPEDKFFCHGNATAVGSGITFIINKDFSVKILPNGMPCYRSGGIFHKDFVYVFGGQFKYWLNIAQKFNLRANK